MARRISEDVMSEELGSEYDGELDSDDYLNSDEEYVELAGDGDGLGPVASMYSLSCHQRRVSATFLGATRITVRTQARPTCPHVI